MRQNDPLRAVSDDERTVLRQVSRSGTAAAAVVARAKAVLAVAGGASYTAAAQAAGRRSGDAVGRWVARFNREGLAALTPGHGGGQSAHYTSAERERILAEAYRMPDREADGTATWSLVTLQRALRRAPDGLPQVSTYTIWGVLSEAGWSWQRTRTWCPTGSAVRKRKVGPVTVHDPDAEAKVADRASLPRSRTEWSGDGGDRMASGAPYAR
ncbi:MAG TPA: helix-turn-helix domain-containing protein [Ktedonobacterales bacterium]|nr:helix-turn-helix domain-containing protein [Ktedonobacterales bacterium]